jgi:hypothetical protein
MDTLTIDAIEGSGLDVLETDLIDKLDSLHDGFQTSVEPINGWFGYLSAEVASNLLHWPQSVLDKINSAEEARVYQGAGLRGGVINGREVMMREIDPFLVDADGVSNMQKMELGLAPIDANGEKIELHHINQEANAPFAELTTSEHDNLSLHPKKESEIDRYAFRKEREAHWKNRAERFRNEMSLRGRVFAASDMAVKSGLAAASLTLAISTVENIQGVMSGELSPEEAFVDVAKDTGTAGAIGYGVGFVSEAIAKTMSASGQTLIRSLGNANVPAAAIAFGIDSYDSVIEFAQGKIDGEGLAVDLGGSAAGVFGSIGGAALAGAAVGSIVPGAGTAAGFAAGLVGGMVGYAVATGAYATVIEVSSSGVNVITDKFESVAEGAGVIKGQALEIGQTVIDSVASTAPEAVNDVKNAMNDFAAGLGVPIRL